MIGFIVFVWALATFLLCAEFVTGIEDEIYNEDIYY